MKSKLFIFFLLTGIFIHSCDTKQSSSNSLFTEEIMKNNQIKTINTIMYTYTPEELIMEDSTKITTVHYDKQGRIVEIIRHGDSTLYQPTLFDYHTYKDNKAEIIRKDGNDNILSRVTYIRTDTSLTTEGYTTEGELDWKRVEKYFNNNPKKPLLVEWYNKEGNNLDRHVYRYDDIGLVEIQRYQYNKLKNSETRINNDKYRLEFEGKDDEGIIYKNVTIYDDNERLIETFFENFINEYFTHQIINYADNGLRKEEIIYNKSGNPERLIKYYYEKW